MDNFILNVARMPIVGTSVKNNDGSTRQDIIRNLKSGDPLILKWEAMPSVPYLVSVYTTENKKIGNLNARLAENMIEKYKGYLISGRIAEVPADADHLVCNVDIFIANSIPIDEGLTYTPLILFGDLSCKEVNERLVKSAAFSALGFILAAIFYAKSDLFSFNALVGSVILDGELFNTEKIISIFLPVILVIIGYFANRGVWDYEHSLRNEVMKAISKIGLIGTCALSFLSLVLYLILVINFL